MRVANRRVGHDRGVVLEGVADVAVFVGVFSDGPVVQLIRVVNVVVPLVAVVLPRNLRLEQSVADAGDGRRRDGEDRVVGVGVGVGVVAISEVSRVVIVQEIVVVFLAACRDRRAQRLQIFNNGTNAGLCFVRAVGVGAATEGR